MSEGKRASALPRIVLCLPKLKRWRVSSAAALAMSIPAIDMSESPTNSLLGGKKSSEATIEAITPARASL